MKLGDEIKRLTLSSDGRTYYVIPAYGYLERIEIRPTTGLIPNMNASNPYKAALDLWDEMGKIIPVDIDVWCRTVKEN